MRKIAVILVVALLVAVVLPTAGCRPPETGQTGDAGDQAGGTGGSGGGTGTGSGTGGTVGDGLPITLPSGNLAFGLVHGYASEAPMWFATAELDGLGVVEHFLLNKNYFNLYLSPDGTKLMATRWDDSIDEQTWWLFDLARGGVTQLPIPDDHGIIDVLWSGDSRCIAYLDMGDIAAGTQDRIVLISSDDGTEVSANATTAEPAHGAPGQRGRMAWLPEGSVVAFIGRTAPLKTGLWLRDVDSGAERLLVDDILADRLRPSPDGRTIALKWTSDDGRVELVRVSDGGRVDLCALDDRVFEMVWSPDSAKLAIFHGASGLGNIKIDIWDVGSRTRLVGTGEIAQWDSTYHPHATWSPDGTAVYFLAGGFMLTKIYRVDAATGEAEAIYTCASGDQLHSLLTTP